MLLKIENRRSDGKAFLTRGHSRKPLALSDRIGQVYIELLFHRRFVIEKSHLRWSSRLEEVDDTFRFRRKIRERRLGSSRHEILTHERRKRRSSNTCRRLTEELTAVQDHV